MDETKNTPETEEVVQEPQAEAETAPAVEGKPDPTAELQAKLSAEHDNFLRLAAEYDNFRKRTQKERESLYQDAKADTVGKFLPVYDNLQRAMAQETADEAYKKGVEMTMQGFESILEALNVKAFGAAGEPFNPAFHNAVMHVDDEALGENIIAEVFQTGFQMGEKVIRHAMVKVAN